MRQKPGSGWTLLYIKHNRQSLALAQVYLNPQTRSPRLLDQVYPEIRAAMDKRTAPWKLRFQEEAPWLDELEVWEHPEGRQRQLEALWAWWSFHQAREGKRAAARLREVHRHSLEDGCACLLGAAVEVDSEALDLESLAAALAAWREHGRGPQALAGVTRIRG